MARMNARHRVDFRREEAQQRASAREHRTPEQQMALLDSRLGAGNGATKERARLQAMIDKKASDQEK